MIHVYEKGADTAVDTLVLFHGTGGTERDLLPLARRLYPGAGVLSLRGNVLENGMPRFFRRIAEGVFDEADLVFRTQEIYAFLGEAAHKYGFDPAKLIAVGYSNGANIIASLLFHYKAVFRQALLHHPMVPLRGLALPDMSGVRVFIGAGKNDPICAPQETEELHQLLTGAGADVHVHWETYGHQLSRTEVEAAAGWLERNSSDPEPEP